MTNKEKLIQGLLAGVGSPHSQTRASAYVAMGESGLIDDDRLVNALIEGVNDTHWDGKQGAYTGMGLMLRNSDRQ